MSGYRGAMAKAISLDSKGDVTDKAAWTYDKATPYVPSPAIAGDRLYFTATNTAILTCLDAKTGKPILDRVRLNGLRNLYGSPVVVNDHIYIADREGTTLVLEHKDKLRTLAVNKLEDTFDASPVVIGDRLLLRGEKYLYCIGK
jgi:outer membrane protein assembly factor BamB